MSDEAESAVGSSRRGVGVSGLLLHNAVLNDGRLAVRASEHGSTISVSPIILQLSDSMKRRPTSTTVGHLLYCCPVRVREGRDVIGEISLPCEDSTACHQRNVYLSCSELH